MNLQPFIKNLRVILLTGLVIRILFAFSYDTGDTGAFCNAGSLFLQHKEVYADPAVFFSGPPFALHVTALMHWLGNKIGLPCSGMWKMPTIVADIGIGWLIYFISKKELKKSEDNAIKMAMMYIYNPIAIFISGFQGQQESFWLFFILLAWLLIKRYQKIVIAAICVGIALAYKIPAVLLIPALLFLIKEWRRRLIFCGIIGFIFLISLLPEIITSREALIRQSFLYSSIPGIWGFSGLINKSLALTPQFSESVMKLTSTLLKIILAIGVLIIYRIHLKNKKWNFFQLGLKVFMVFMVFTPGFGTQYLLWLVPFFILSEAPYFLLYSVLVTVVYLHTYGLGFAPLDLILVILQRKVYNPLLLVYPYDIYYPVWLLLVALLWGKEKGFPMWIQKMK
jgi:Gpi18-like mannosyltransferase